MNWLKRLLAGFAIVIVVLLVMGFLLSRFFFRNHEGRPAELVDFKPVSMKIDGGKPFFYAVDDQFFYSETGRLDFNSKAIWSGEIDEGYFHDFQVSPDNQYIAFVEVTKMIVLRKDGKVMTEISPISRTTVDKDRHSGNFIGENFQWSADSKKLFLLCDKKWEDDQSSENVSSIFEYSISKDKTTEFINLKEECRGSFFFDLSYQHLYYHITMGGDFYIKRIRIDNSKESKIHESPGIQIEGIAKDSVFIDYTNAQFGNWDGKGINLFSEDSYGVFYLYTPDSVNRTVFKTKSGYGAFKGTGYGFRNGRSGFLPNDKFYYTGSWAKEFEGTIFIDVETLNYTFIEKDFRCYYSKTNLDFPDFVLRHEIEPDLEFETSH